MIPFEKRLPLLGLPPEEITQMVQQEFGMPRYAGKQIAHWLYVKRVTEIDRMTNLSVKHRQALAERYCVGREEPVHRQASVDGTVKYLFAAAGGFVETVYIPDGERATLCVSSQVGCKMNCLFCHTGKQGFTAQLTAQQIINQIFSIPESSSLTNVVFMGMGEPMDNLPSVLQALQCLTHPDAVAWSSTRITVSTIGVEPQLSRFLQESRCHLAVSLHSPFDDERAQLMPAQKAFPIAHVMETLRKHRWEGQRRLTFEYIVFGTLNDTRRHMNALLNLTEGLPCRLNLIRYHAIPGIDLPATDPERLQRMQEYLSSRGLITTIRASRGEDIAAACGMLSTRAQSKTQEGGV